MKNMILVGLLLLFAVRHTLAQLPDFHQSFDAPSEQRKEAAQKRLEQLYEKKIEKLEAQHRGFYKDIYRDTRDMHLGYVENDRVIFDPLAADWIKAIFKEIVDANPQLDNRNAYLNLTTDDNTNAFATPLGVINLNIGLLAKCQNRSEVAFILCHELSHLELMHNDKSIDRVYEALYSEKAKREMKEIVRMSTGATEAAIKYMERVQITLSSRSVTDETQADSLAIVLMRNTKFDARASISTLMMLDSADIKMQELHIDLKKFFSFADYPFKQKWVEKPSGNLFGGASFVTVDSVKLDSFKTHPDCVLRASLAEKWLNDYTSPLGAAATPDDVAYLQNVAFEHLDILERNGNLDITLLNIINLIQDNPDNKYLWLRFFQCMNALARVQTEHTFSKNVAISCTNRGLEYEQYICFLNRLTIKEMANINYRYFLAFAQKNEPTEDTLVEWIAILKYMGNTEEMTTQKELFLSKYPRSRHIARVNKF